MNDLDAKQKMYSIDDIATELRVSRKLIRRYVASGQLAAVQNGTKYEILEASYKRFCDLYTSVDSESGKRTLGKMEESSVACLDSDIQQMIRTVGGIQVMLDSDLARLYGVEVKQLNRQVRRNITRFPEDFMFQLTKEDCSRCQIGTLNRGRGSNVKYLPYVFTENGIAMLSSVLRSETAIEVNIQTSTCKRCE